MHITMTRDALLARLKEQLAVAKKEDAIAEKAHHKEEEKALADFKSRIRECLKWDYATAKAKRYSGWREFNTPSCPKRHATFFDRLIKQVELDTRKGSFKLGPSSDLHQAVTWVPPSQKQKETVCD